MPSVKPSDLKNTTCLFRLFEAFAARDARTQQASIEGTSDGAKYTSNANVLSPREAVDNYLTQFPSPCEAEKVGRCWEC